MHSIALRKRPSISGLAWETEKKKGFSSWKEVFQKPSATLPPAEFLGPGKGESIFRKERIMIRATYRNILLHEAHAVGERYKTPFAVRCAVEFFLRGNLRRTAASQPFEGRPH